MDALANQEASMGVLGGISGVNPYPIEAGNVHQQREGSLESRRGRDDDAVGPLGYRCLSGNLGAGPYVILEREGLPDAIDV